MAEKEESITAGSWETEFVFKLSVLSYCFILFCILFGSHMAILIGYSWLSSHSWRCSVASWELNLGKCLTHCTMYNYVSSVQFYFFLMVKITHWVFEGKSIKFLSSHIRVIKIQEQSWEYKGDYKYKCNMQCTEDK